MLRNIGETVFFNFGVKILTIHGGVNKQTQICPLTSTIFNIYAISLVL